MSKINSLLSKRLEASKNLSKMKELAERSSQGNLSSFSGIFRITPLSSAEKEKIETILTSYKKETHEIDKDLSLLLDITSEVKAINNQAAILHGERIKKAQTILKNYQDGAFSAWLVATYGNRQTPYNFLQYYELYQQLPEALYQQLDAMPRQAVYTLASRPAPLEQKEAMIKEYRGQTKNECLDLIRKSFPLAGKDQRAQDLISQATTQLKRLKDLFEDPRFKPTQKQKFHLKDLLKALSKGLSGNKFRTFTTPF
jgi:phosphoglycerate-specific signal transduction histidine kinase